MKQILVLEDCEDIYEVMTDCLADIYDLTHAKNIDDAEKFLKSKSFSLVLADIDLPDGNGLEFCKTMSQAIGSPAFLLVTGYDDIGEKVYAFASGATDYLTKPFDQRELRARVQAILKRVK